MNTVRGYFKLLNGRDSLSFPKETIKRVESFGRELSKKRSYRKFTTFNSSTDEMVVVKDIKVFSFCEHHLLPFFGYCSIAYIPNGKILGLSKFQRLVDKMSARPCTQEELTEWITNFLESVFDVEHQPTGIGVSLTCVHTCMYGRGINTSSISVDTQVLRGKIYESTGRHEFLSRIRHENILR